MKNTKYSYKTHKPKYREISGRVLLQKSHRLAWLETVSSKITKQFQPNTVALSWLHPRRSYLGMTTGARVVGGPTHSG